MTSAAIEGEALRALLPHAGDMCLLERIESWSPIEIRCTTLTHRDARHPLRRDNHLPAVHLVEYAAQAMALHGALLDGGRPQPGVLAAVRDARLHAVRIDTFAAPLDVIATRRMAQVDGFIYEYIIRCADSLLSTGRITIALRHSA